MTNLTILEITVFIYMQRPELYFLLLNNNILAGIINIYILNIHHQLYYLKQLYIIILYFPEDLKSVHHIEHYIDYLRQVIFYTRDAILKNLDPGKRTLNKYRTTH
ncbi:hypothetical protein ASPFODRAFT_62717 [Aspergillus luchuensis CBS 106.47]|uniref:Uncharacterized protein n=1 Tax=Aspergillus luchuensis (strain CBS 106.47) TaxID=1137211 RepID=A0A1M3T9Y0_ASPLC|nr:hypothetical protein ASPFODRAFT_62717 [Aspergillus luchuensis CBS 106.47]